MKKAYKITTKANEIGEWLIYSGENAGKVKTFCVNHMKEAYSDATYSWINSCKRIPEYDELANKYNGCIAWKIKASDQISWERWEQDKSNWFE
jgi:hypothetical protein